VIIPGLGRHVDMLSAVWLYEIAFFTGWLYLVWLIVSVDVCYDDWYKKIQERNRHEETKIGITVEHTVIALGLYCIGSAMWLPLMVVLASMNVSFIVVALKSLEDPFREEYFSLYNRAPAPAGSGLQDQAAVLQHGRHRDTI